jgi:hypothetical protein
MLNREEKILLTPVDLNLRFSKIRDSPLRNLDFGHFLVVEKSVVSCLPVGAFWLAALNV